MAQDDGAKDLEIYEHQGFGNAMGFGERPALLIVDFVNGFTDPDAFGGGNIAEAIANTELLLEAARRVRVPVVFTRVVYADDGSDLGVFGLKAPSLATLTEDASASHVVPQLRPKDGELVLRKTQASAFFATPLAGWLINRGIDTVIVTGCTTSGCVRASVVDAMSYNFRTIVAVDGVGDRALGPHEANLFDMGQKYADLWTTGEILERLERESA